MKFAAMFRAALLAALLTLLGGFVMPAAAESPALATYSAEYKVKISVLSGKLTTELRQTDSGYEAEHVIRPSGLAKVIRDRKSTRLNSSHSQQSRMPSSA